MLKINCVVLFTGELENLQKALNEKSCGAE